MSNKFWKCPVLYYKVLPCQSLGRALIGLAVIDGFINRRKRSGNYREDWTEPRARRPVMITGLCSSIQISPIEQVFRSVMVIHSIAIIKYKKGSRNV